MKMKNKNSSKKPVIQTSQEKQKETQLQYFIQPIEIKRDSGMTRIYSATLM